MTWSPMVGTSPDPIRRSSALTPPELGSSLNSSGADFAGEEVKRNEKIENEEGGKIADSERSLLVSTTGGGGGGVDLLVGRESL